MGPQLVILAVLAGISFLAWKFLPAEGESQRSRRATRAANKEPLSAESLSNIIRLECNKGSNEMD